LVERLVERRRGEARQVAHVAIAVALVEAAGADVVGRDQEDEVVRPAARPGLRLAQQPGAEPRALSLSADQQKAQIGGAREDPARDHPREAPRRPAPMAPHEEEVAGPVAGLERRERGRA
jgi:hypothetical protein